MDEFDTGSDTREEFTGLAHLPHLSGASSIATEDGPVAAGWLRAGDLVVTRDRGLQPVLSIGRLETTRGQLVDNLALWPIRIEAGALGRGNPAQPLIVSPDQRLLVCGAEIELNLGLTEAFVAARHLLDWPGVEALMPEARATGYQILFERHEVILADGQWTESLFLDVESLAELRSSDPRALVNFGGHRRIARPEISVREASLLRHPADFVPEVARAIA